MKEVKYIPESKSWLVNGRIIKDEELSADERQRLMAECTGNYEVLDARDDVPTRTING